MDYAQFVVIVCVLLSIYGLLLVAKVLIMKIQEDELRSAKKIYQLQIFLQKKTLKHILFERFCR